MKYTFLIINLLLISISSFAQKEVKPTIFTTVPAGQTKTLKINVSNYDINIIGQLKDNLLIYSDKITFVGLDEGKRILTVIYNEYMLKEDLIRVFETNGVNYHIQTKMPDSSNNLTN